MTVWIGLRLELPPRDSQERFACYGKELAEG